MPVESVHADNWSGLPLPEWRTLAESASVYASPGWLAVREEELPPSAHVRYLLARDRDGLAAGLAAYRFAEPPHPLYDPTALLAPIMGSASDKFDNSPFLLATGWSEFRGDLLCRPSRASITVDRVVEDAMQWGATTECSLVAFLFVTLDDAISLTAALRGAGMPVLHDVETVLPTAWETFDDYLSWLPGRRRAEARRDIRDFEASGRTVRQARLVEVLEAVAPLNAALMRKYGHGWSDARARATFARQARHLNSSSSVLVAEDDGVPVGFVLRYLHAGDVFSRVVGFDYSLPNRSEYFVLSFYEAVKYGIANSTKQLHLGLGTLDAKLPRGAQPRPLYHVFAPLRGRFTAGERRTAERLSTARRESFKKAYGRLVVGGADDSLWHPGDWAGLTSDAAPASTELAWR